MSDYCTCCLNNTQHMTDHWNTSGHLTADSDPEFEYQAYLAWWHRQEEPDHHPRYRRVDFISLVWELRQAVLDDLSGCLEGTGCIAEHRDMWLLIDGLTARRYLTASDAMEGAYEWLEERGATAGGGELVRPPREAPREDGCMRCWMVCPIVERTRMCGPCTEDTYRKYPGTRPLPGGDDHE